MCLVNSSIIIFFNSISNLSAKGVATKPPRELDFLSCQHLMDLKNPFFFVEEKTKFQHFKRWRLFGSVDATIWIQVSGLTVLSQSLTVLITLHYVHFF